MPCTAVIWCLMWHLVLFLMPMSGSVGDVSDLSDHVEAYLRLLGIPWYGWAPSRVCARARV